MFATDTFKHDRRRFVAAAGLAFAASHLAIVAAGRAAAADLPKVPPGTNTAFRALRQIDAGVLNVGYAEEGRPTASRSCCCTAGRTTSTPMSTSRRCWPRPATG